MQNVSGGGLDVTVVTGCDEIKHALEEVTKVVNKALHDCGKMLEIYNDLLAVISMKNKTPKEYGEYLQKALQITASDTS